MITGDSYNGRMKMTRRALAGLTALAAVPLTQSTGQAPAPARAPEDALGAASRQFRDAARQLAAVKLPRTVEPAVRFEA